MPVIAFPDLILTDEHIDMYRRLFIQNNTKYRYKIGVRENGKDDWRESPGQITDQMLYDHFTGRKQYCSFTLEQTNYFVIDLDLDFKDPPSILQRYIQIKRALGTPTFVLRSSIKQIDLKPLNGGLHLYYVDDKYHPTKRLKDGVKDFLTRQGVAVESGKVEILPDCGNSLRLPFSCVNFQPREDGELPKIFNNSILVDTIVPSKPFMLLYFDKFPSFAESIEIACKIRIRTSLDHLVQKEKLPQQVSFHPSSKPRSTRDFIVRPAGAGTHNEVWLEWVRQLSQQGYNTQEIRSIIINRMDNPEYNTGSKDWSHNRSACIYQLDFILRRNEERRGEHWSYSPDSEVFPEFYSELPLAESEVQFIFRNTPKNAKGKYDFKIQIFLFNLMKLLKEKLDRGLSEIPIEAKAFSRCRNIRSRDGNPIYIAYASSIGIITQTHDAVRPVGASEGIAAIYSINSTHFNLSSPGKFSDFHSALQFMFKDNFPDLLKFYTSSNLKHYFTATEIASLKSSHKRSNKKST